MRPFYWRFSSYSFGRSYPAVSPATLDGQCPGGSRTLLEKGIMARPLPLPDPHRSGANGSPSGRPASAGPLHLHPATVDEAQASINGLEVIAEDEQAAELEHYRSENAQLRALCLELEQALQEAAQQIHPDLEQQIREYDAVLEEKNERIRQLHLQLQESQAILEDSEARVSEAAPARTHQGPAPCEDELLALSEELER